ncbi:MAG: hypothetical protein KGL39_15495 [Patescibacteria group bacterium]|nr:hypothetical protein [Patescibacteria group bacterium]
MSAEPIAAADVALELLRAHGWNSDKAIEAALARSDRDPRLAQQVLRAGWETLLRNIGSRQRDVLVRRVTASVDSTARLQRTAKEGFLETWIIFGMPLGRCTDDDLRRSIGLRKASAQTELKRVEFEKALLKKMKPGKRVMDCWNETDIAALARTTL